MPQTQTSLKDDAKMVELTTSKPASGMDGGVDRSSAG